MVNRDDSEAGVAPAENQGRNTNFTLKHEDKIESLERDVAELKRAMFGDERYDYKGVVATLKNLQEGLKNLRKDFEEGSWRKLLKRQNWNIWLIVVGFLTLIITALK